MNKRTFKNRIFAFAMMLTFMAAFVLTSINVGVEKAYADEGGFEITLSGMDPENPTDGTEISFSNAEISVADEYKDKKVTALIVSVNVGSITDSTISSLGESADGVMTDNLTNHQTVTCYWNAGKTIDDITTLLKSIEYIYASGMKITVTVDTNETNLPVSDGSRITTRILSQPITERQAGDSIHYYMFVPTVTGSDLNSTETNAKYSDVTWSQAYVMAKSYYFMGMQGYLATITERSEDEALNDITNVGAWAGGVRLQNSVVDAEGINFFDYNPTSDEISSTLTEIDKKTKNDSDLKFKKYINTSPSTGTGSSWYWIDGPEAGYYINTLGSYMTKKDGTFDMSKNPAAESSDSSSTAAHYGGKYGSPASKDNRDYSDWRRKNGRTTKPDTKSNTDQEPNNSSGEWCLQVHYPGSEDSEQQLVDPKNTGKYLGWNDLSNQGNKYGQVKGYFVEFSKYTDANGNPVGSYKENPSVTVTLDVDHKHTWKASIAPEDPTKPDSTPAIKLSCECKEEHTIVPKAADAEYTGQPYEGLDIADTITSSITGYTKTVSYEGVNGTTYSSSDPPTNVGNYKVVVTLLKDGEVVKIDGNDAKVEKTFSITHKAVIITAKEQTIAKGDSFHSDSVGDVTASGLIDGDSVSSVSVDKTTEGSTEVVKPSDAHIGNGSGTDVTSNYNITYNSGTLTQTKRTLNVTASPTPSGITYGDTLSTSTFPGDGETGVGVVKDSATGDVIPGTWVWVDDSTQKPGDIRPQVSDSGTTKYKAKFVPNDTDIYDPIEVNDITLTVAPKEITISWNYDDNNPYTYDGTEHKPTASVQKPDGFPDSLTLPEVSVTAKAGTTAGLTPTLTLGVDATPEGTSYQAEAALTETAAGNYVISDTGNKTCDYKVKPADLSVTLKDQTIKKKETIKQGTDEIKQSSELKNGDTITDITIDADRTDAANPKVTGTSITIKTSDGSKDVTNNYNVTYTPGKLTEEKITLTKDDNVTKDPTVSEITYGQPLSESTITPGVVKYNGQEIKGRWEWVAPDTTPDAGDSGQYTLRFVPTKSDGTDDPDYTPIEFPVTVKVNPKEIGINWGANEFTYNGQNQAPTASFKDGDILTSDQENVSITVSGVKTDSNQTATSEEEKDHYVATASLSGDKAGNYIIKESGDDGKNKNFKINPLELGNTPQNNTVELMVGKDSEGNPIISSVYIKDDATLGVLSGKKLTEIIGTNPGDYKQKITEDGNYLIIEADFAGNYKGSAKRTITKPKKTEIKTDTDDVVGEMEIFVQVDNTVDKSLNPNISRVTDSTKTEEESVLESFLDTFEDVTLTGGGSLKEKIESKDTKYVTYADKFIDLNQVKASSINPVEQNVVANQKKELAQSVGKKIEDPIYLDLTMRQEYEVLEKAPDGTLKPISGTDSKGNQISQVKVSEPIYTNAGENVQIEFDFPAQLIKDGMITKCYVLRVHNRVNDDGAQTGTLEPEYVLRDKVVTRANRKIVFTTNKFSTYVVMYTAEPAGKGNGGGSGDKPSNNSQKVIEVTTTPYTMPVAYAAPKTGDSDLVYILIAIMAAGVCIVVGGKKKKNK